ncbi:MAG: hypothetical protein ACOX45_02320 [Acutalibacteraceae bacterium]
MKSSSIKVLLSIACLIFLCFSVSCSTILKEGEITSEKDDSNGSNINSRLEETERGQEAEKTEDYSEEFDKIMTSSLELYDNYSFKLQNYKYDGNKMIKTDTTSAVFCEKGWVIYPDEGDGGRLFINKGNKFYSIDVQSKTKKLIVEGENAVAISRQANISSYSDLLTEHKNYPRQLFKREGIEQIAGRECVKYTVDGKNLAASPEIEYWFDLETGLILKAITKMQVSDISSINQWEITEFEIKGQSIDSYIDFKDIK